MRKLTQEQATVIIGDICTERNYTFTKFEYVGNLTRINFKCNTCLYEWNAYYSTFVNQRRGCMKCGGKAPLTQDEATQRITESSELHNVSFKSFVYTSGSKTKIEFECQEGHTWTRSFSLAIKNSSCPKCTKENNSNKQREEFAIVAHARILEMCKEKNCTVGEYKWISPTKTFLPLTCNVCNFQWNTTSANHFMNNKSSCTKCASHGYNPSKPGYLYVHKITSYNTNGLWFKIGITGSYEQRFNQLSQNTYRTEKHRAFYCENGEVIQLLEREIKRQVKTGVLKKQQYKDGHSETINSTDYDDVLNIINEWTNKHSITEVQL